VILCTTFEFFVRVTSCSNSRPFEVQGSTVIKRINELINKSTNLLRIKIASN
jgi:hypothetical protein